MPQEEPIVPLMNSTILKVSDGTEMAAYVAKPKSEKAPGLIVLPEAFGVNKHIRSVCDRFAEQGYLAIAPELFHRTAPRNFEGPYDNFPAVMSHYQAVTEKTLDVDLQATYDWLASQSQVDKKNISCIGYCLGGRATFYANSFLPLRAAVSYYGGGIAPGLLHLAEKQKAPILLVWGGLDANIGSDKTQAVAQALKKAGKPYAEITFSQGDHGFFCEDKKVYNAQVSSQAWALTLAFIR